MRLFKQVACRSCLVFFSLSLSAYAFDSYAQEQENVVYSVAVVPEKMTVQEKKLRFKSLLLPVIKKVHDELQAQYLAVHSQLILSDRQGIAALKTQYKVKSDAQLLLALKPHPISVVLAQAAMESSWATSRFIREANNAFGIWSFNENEPRIAANQVRGNKKIWLKRYANLEDSVRDSFKLLSTHKGYRMFREKRFQTEDPYLLVAELSAYSEIGADYAKHLSGIIRHNKFNALD